MWEENPNSKFAAKLYSELRALIVVQNVRRVMYREHADEWPIGHTPPELKAKREAEVKVLIEREGATSDDSSESDNDNDAGGRRGGRKKAVEAAADQPNPPPQTDLFPTPPLSTDGPPSAPPRGKRRRISGAGEEDDERKKRPRMTLAGSITSTGPAKHVLPNVSQEMSRKCRWTSV